MSTTDPLTNRRTGGDSQAQERFVESTRSSSFNLSLGIREIRMLHENDWRMMYGRLPHELATLQRLVDKGLVSHVEGENPRLSEAGRLVRELLILSKHIVPAEHPERLAADDILGILAHGMSWYRDGNHFLESSRIQRGIRAEQDELRLTTSKLDYSAIVQDELRRPRIKQEFRIRRENIEEIK